jgi:hypothetical protein
MLVICAYVLYIGIHAPDAYFYPIAWSQLLMAGFMLFLPLTHATDIRVPMTTRISP